jgi:CheY-like chemotaxis protein
MNNFGRRLLFRQSKDVSFTVLGGMVEPCDVDIHVVDDPRDIIAAAYDRKPDAIVLAETEDKTELFALCEAVRATSEICDVPILVLCVASDKNVRLAALKSGADECLCVFSDASEIALKLGNMLKIQRFRRSLAEQNLFAMTCEQVEHGMLLLDGSGGVLQANLVAQTKFGVSVDCGKTWIEQLSDRYTIRPEANVEDPSVKSALKVLTILECIGTHGDNRSRQWYRCLSYPLLDDPEGRVLVTIIDVTKQLEMEDILLGVKRLISHKMLTPLNGIIAPLEIVLEDEADGNDRVKLLETALESAEELAAVVSRLEDYFVSPFSIEESDSMKVSELKAIISQAASDLLIAGIEYDIRVPAKTQVPVGPQKLLTIFIELLENAVKFHPRHRPFIQVYAQVHSDKLRIDVIDDGGQIPPESIGFVSLPFYQPGVGLAGEISGHGVGLAQVSRIIMAAGGNVRFTNLPSGKGVCVSIFLPISSTKDSKNMTNADIFAGN